jgi:hypothetical protein
MRRVTSVPQKMRHPVNPAIDRSIAPHFDDPFATARVDDLPSVFHGTLMSKFR